MVSKQWKTVEQQYASKIRELLFTFLTKSSPPRYVRTKAAKVYVNVGIQDWPERYPGFWKHIEHTAMQDQTKFVGTHILEIALESFGNVDKKTSLNLLSSRRKKLKHMMKAQMPSLMKLMEVLLQKSIVSNDEEMTVLSLRSLLNLLTYNQIRDLPDLSLLNVLFKTMQCYKNEIGVTSMRCFVEIMNSVTVPPDRVSYLLSVAKHILGLLNTFASRPELRHEAEENYVAQLLSFVLTFIKRHMSRIYCNDEFPMKQTLELIHKFTFIQCDDAANFLVCLEIWVATANFVSETMEQRVHELNAKQRQRLGCFEPIFSNLMKFLLPRALMSRGGEIILSLDDEEPTISNTTNSTSESAKSELVSFQHRILDSIAMMLFSPNVTNAFSTLLVPFARTALQILGSSSSSQQHEENQRRAAIDLAVVFESISTSSHAFSPLQNLQVQVVQEILQLAISTARTSTKRQMYSRGSAYRRLHISSLLTTSRLLIWCRGICDVPTSSNPQIKNRVLELAENAVDVALNSIVTSISIPPESIIKSGLSLLRSIVLNLDFLNRHPHQWKSLKILGLGEGNGAAFAHFATRLSRFAQGQIYALLARASINYDAKSCEQWMRTMMQPILEELLRCSNSDAVGSHLEMASSRIERACLICTAVIKEFRHATKDKRLACMRALKSMIDSSSTLLIAFVQAVSQITKQHVSCEVMSGRAAVRAKRKETLLLRTSKHLFELHDAVFQNIGHVVNSEYVKSAVSAILHTMTDDVLNRLLHRQVYITKTNKRNTVQSLRHSMSSNNNNSVVLLEHCIGILTSVMDDRTKHFHAMIFDICKFMIQRVYPCLVKMWKNESMSVDLTNSYFTFLRAALMNHHGIFVISKTMSRAKNMTRNFTSRESEIFFRGAFESMAICLEIPNVPPSMIDNVLKLFLELDEKHGSITCFDPVMLSRFGSLLLRMICSRSHELLEDVLMKATYAVAKANGPIFSNSSVTQFMRSLRAESRLKPDVVMNLQTRIRNCKGSSHEFQATLNSVMNDLACFL